MQILNAKNSANNVGHSNIHPLNQKLSI